MSFASLTVVLTGAIVLAIEAIQQFRKPSQDVSSDRFSILRGVQIDAISTVGERARGAALYVFFYLLIYGVLIGSDELYQVFSDASGDVVGPSGINFLSDDTSGGSDLTVDQGLARPFYIAAAIMFAMVSGMLAPIERAIRNIAHRAANIPNGVFRIVEGLEAFDISQKNVDAALKQEGGQLVDLFDGKFPKKAGWELSESAFDDLRSFLAQIDLLIPTITGAARNRLFSTASTASMGELRDALSRAYTVLRQELEALDGARSLDQQTQFQQHALELRDNVMALFAVQFIRNGRSFSPLSQTSKRPRDELFRQINNKLRHEQEANINSVVGATFYCVMGTFLAVGLLYVVYVSMAVAPPESGGTRFTSNVVTAIANQSFGFALIVPAMCLVSSFFTLLIRDIRREQGKWQAWTMNAPPYARLLTTAIFPSLLGAAAVGLIMVIWEVASSRVTTQEQLAYFLQGSALYLAFFIPLAGLVSVGVLIATDQHDALLARDTIRSTLRVAIPVFIIAVGCAVFAVSNKIGDEGARLFWWKLREAMFLFMPIMIFLTAYAGLLELSEEGGKNKGAKT